MPNVQTVSDLPTLEEIRLARAAERARLEGPCECCRERGAVVLMPIVREDDCVEIPTCDPCADVIQASYAAPAVAGN